MRKILAGVLVLLMAAGMLVVFTGCGGNGDPVDHPIVGSWDWEGAAYYLFNADGTGTRDANSMFEPAHPIFWSASEGTLYICTTPNICNNAADCPMPELWNYTIVGNTLTIASQQVPGLEFAYTRSNAVPANNDTPPADNVDGVWQGAGFSMEIAPGWSQATNDGLTFLRAPDGQSNINVLQESAQGLDFLAYIEATLEQLEATFEDFVLFDTFFDADEGIALLDYSALVPGAAKALYFTQAFMYNNGNVFIATLTDFDIGTVDLFEDFLDMLDTFEVR